MNATGLLVLLTTVEGWLESVAGSGGEGKKAESIEVGTGERLAFHELGDVVFAQSQRCAFPVPDFLATINHGPFVKTVAAKVGRTISGGLQEAVTEAQACDVFFA
jgi:hypothetical protein